MTQSRHNSVYGEPVVFVLRADASWPSYPAPTAPPNEIKIIKYPVVPCSRVSENRHDIIICYFDS